MGDARGHEISSEDWSSKDSHMDKDNHRAAPTDHEQHIAALPPSEVQQTTTALDSHKTSSHLQNARSKLGLHPTAPIVEEHDYAKHSDLWWPRVRLALKEPFAEFFGVFFMVMFGDGAVAQVLLSTDQRTAPGGDGFGDYQSINWGWGLGVMLGIYIAGDSGAYLNPALTFTNCVLRKLPWRRFPVYFIAQFLGGFLAAGVIYINYINGINNFEGYGNRTVPPSKTATAGIFCTYPQDFETKAGMFFSGMRTIDGPSQAYTNSEAEFIASAILMFVIFALKDDSNKGQFSASGAWFPLGLFFLIFGIGACFGWQTGYAINLARDFGPRLMSYAVGYGHEVWSAGGYYFWIPMVAPFLGTLFGGILYDIFIYTGPSPINTPYLGLGDLFRPKNAIKDRVETQKTEGIV
ncbi:glycerol channel [Vermiconidia calcicola]|uniref:Glycerol channel n=1 Tax=Vermiconidia calcicola TaxID=1690605 RepID=A0ACC3N7J6_9PEZI|nr:glycerol channel [Vermiconidia calcicola]